jgi:formate C-acetyltransferase
MKFNKNLFSPQALGKMASLVKTFLQLGGFELQINVVDRETLLKARERPEEYGDLIVRVGGYSDYFVHLPPAMQEEVLERTAHEL